MNIRVKHGRLDMRRNFFSLRVIDSWNQIPSEVKRSMREVPEGLQRAESKPVAPRQMESARESTRCEQGATRSGCSLRGSTWAMGDDFTSKQVKVRIGSGPEMASNWKSRIRFPGSVSVSESASKRCQSKTLCSGNRARR